MYYSGEIKQEKNGVGFMVMEKLMNRVINFKAVKED